MGAFLPYLHLETNFYWCIIALSKYDDTHTMAF